MLHTETIEGTTLQLLKNLQGEQLLSTFNLAGGTALSLYLGHRKSIDLDLFTPYSFDTPKLKNYLEKVYDFRTGYMEKDTLKGTIMGIKIDCITYAYDTLESPYTEMGIRLYSIEDIIAMKLSAIADNGTRLKDFIDIAYLSTRFSFYSMLKCYERKYPKANVIRPFKAITYFNDIDFDEDIVMLNTSFQWGKIERRLIAMTQDQSQIFSSTLL